MSLPASFRQYQTAPRKYRRLMIGTDGPSDSGKSEFIYSCPGPGLVLCLDRGIEGMLENPNPPAQRRDDFLAITVSVPPATSAPQPVFHQYWCDFYAKWKEVLGNPDALTVALDGDSDSWELQRLAAFGQLQQIPSIRYVDVNAARRAMIAKAYDSGKNIIATNKVKAEYVPVLNPDGTPQLTNTGQEKREKSGEMERQGFSDQDYLWQMQLRHMFKPAYTHPKRRKLIPKQWGIRIMKCKHNMDLIGAELWGDECNFTGLVQLVFPEVPLEAWGL